MSGMGSLSAGLSPTGYGSATYGGAGMLPYNGDPFGPLIARGPQGVALATALGWDNSGGGMSGGNGSSFLDQIAPTNAALAAVNPFATPESKAAATMPLSGGGGGVSTQQLAAALAQLIPDPRQNPDSNLSGR
jgi:hypothetical protein